MKFFFLLLIVSLPFSLFSGEKSPFKVIVLDENIDIQKLAPHQVDYYAPPTRLPSIKKRDEDFLKAGILGVDILGDELDRDLLWVNSKSFALEDLKRDYPKISKIKLAKLIEVVKE
jgi:hypothetical protein